MPTARRRRQSMNSTTCCCRIVLAAAEVNIKLTLDRATRNLSLILGRDAGLLEILASAVGTAIRQQHVVLFIDCRRRLAVGMPAMLLARFAAWLLRSILRPAFLAEGCGLPLAFTPRLIKRRAELVNLLHQLRDSAFQLCDSRSQPLVLRSKLFNFRVHDADQPNPCPDKPPRSL